MIPRCKHGVYSPDGNGKPSEYCSGCTVPMMGLLAMVVGTSDDNSDEDDEFEMAPCPVCWEPILIVDEYDFECSNCGFNGI